MMDMEPIIERVRMKATRNDRYSGCAQAVLGALQETLGIGNPESFKAATVLSGGVSIDQFTATKTTVEGNSERIQRLEEQERAASIEFGELRRDIRHFGEKLDNIGVSLDRIERDNRRERATE